MAKNLIIVLLFSFFGLSGQELPPVVNYGPNHYSAGNQNWMIAQGGNLNLYFANSTGLLEYNGENWNLYPVPNNTIVRSLKVVGDRIYTGAYMEAGFWERDDFGDLVYTSLVQKFSDGIGDGEQFWDIEFLDDLVIFRSFGGIYFYDPARDTITKMNNLRGKPISGIFKLEGELYFQFVGGGLFKIRNGEPELVIPYEALGDTLLMHLYRVDGELALISGKTEFFLWKEKKLQSIIKPVNRVLGNPNILDAIDLESGGIILGTVGKGVVEINAAGDIVNSFNQENVLLNNTVLDLFQDSSGNIWAGLDYGISSIDLNSNFRTFQDNRGEIGSVYASYEKEGALYLGTNQGLYLRKKGQEKFQLIEGTNGQVWFIDAVEDHLFCGHNDGTFVIRDGEAEKISDRLGTWLVKKYADGIYIQGHYNGLSFIKYQNGSFETLPMLENFPHSSKYIEVGEDLDVWVSNEHKGVFQIQLADSLTAVAKIRNYKFSGESGITSSIFRFNDSLYYSSKEKIYQYNEQQDKFIEKNRLNALTARLDRISGKMVSSRDEGSLWGFSNKGIFSIKPAQLSRDYNLDFIYLDQDFRNIAVGYENIKALNESEYLLGIANGYLRFGTPEKNIGASKVELNSIRVSALDAKPVSVKLNETGEFDFKHNNITFNYSSAVHDKYLGAEYSYRLVGLSNNWSKWNRQPQVSFENLPFGDYRFEVKSKVGELVSESVSYEFSIARPYYLNTWAILGYFVLFVLMLYLVHVFNRRHHKKVLIENERSLKMKNLEAEQEIIKLKNEKLEQDMANKNRELAVSTMSLIKKNEFLTSIKEDLKDSADSNKVRSVIKTIDKDISEEDNWKFFKKAFSNADKDFFNKIKEKHPELTSNDLKLCAYLRLNLSSKEIAPLLNISVKSVEIKRYRLRKKMDLEREVNLTDYILAL